MMTTASIQKKELSQEARAYLWSPEVFDGLERLVTAVGGGEDELTALHADVIALCEGSVTEEQLIESIKKLLGLERIRAMTMLDEIVSILMAGKITKPSDPSVLSVPSDAIVVKPAGAVAKTDDHAQDEQELALIKEKHAAVLASAAPVDVESIVKMICGNPVFQFTDSLLKDRCGKLVESRVREVRTAEQTRSQLERSVDSGGLGVTGRRLADMLSMIEQEVTRYQEASLVKHEQEKGAVKEARQKKVIEKQDIAKQEEAQLTKRYEQLTGQVRTAIEQSKVPAAKRPRVAAQASMQEIAFEKRLTGPVEELRLLSLLDFRRLSSDPKQAATKVKDKVGLLEEQGYDKKIEGIKAWRESPLSKLYMGVTRDAVLKGVPIQELLATRRTAKEETLTDEELKAVMELNAELRF